jgi:lysophospholipase L1-like esterase
MRRPLLLALGDCNTKGHVAPGEAYPALVARALGADLVNCGHTMSTVREGWQYARHKLTADVTYLLVQYGLVDSWVTFRGAPYVLYYPDNILRKLARKLVKKLKKVGRRAGLQRLLGTKHVVSPAEYEETLTAIVRHARTRAPGVVICLIATPPHLEEWRNPAIQHFNRLMQAVASRNNCLFVDVYPLLIGRRELYADHTHLNAAGHGVIAAACLEALRGVPSCQ